MFASIMSGALISLMLFYLAPLPLMVAAIGWGPLAPPSAASPPRSASAPSSASITASPLRSRSQSRLVARPSRAARPPGARRARRPNTWRKWRHAEPTIEWYPVGRILLWIAGFAALTTFAALLTLGTDAAAIAETLRAG